MSKAASPQSCTAQRIRVGLTGLAAIFLVVMVAAAGMRPAQSPAPVAPSGETLAVLGVAPGTSPAAVQRTEPRPVEPKRRPART